jgi:hypothetical protein
MRCIDERCEVVRLNSIILDVDKQAEVGVGALRGFQAALRASHNGCCCQHYGQLGGNETLTSL